MPAHSINCDPLTGSLTDLLCNSPLYDLPTTIPFFQRLFSSGTLFYLAFQPTSIGKADCIDCMSTDRVTWMTRTCCYAESRKNNPRCISRNGAKDRSTRDRNAENGGITGPARKYTNQNSCQTTSTINIQKSIQQPLFRREQQLCLGRHAYCCPLQSKRFQPVKILVMDNTPSILTIAFICSLCFSAPAERLLRCES